jgi:eukaryotic-like serine/threonine-protein kinase
VYRARDSRLLREVAVKVLPTAFSDDLDRQRRFEREARAAASLNHPNIVAVHDAGVHEGVAFIVTELLEGETLRQRMSGQSLPGRKAIEYAIQIASGLAAEHE